MVFTVRALCAAWQKCTRAASEGGLHVGARRYQQGAVRKMFEATLGDCGVIGAARSHVNAETICMPCTHHTKAIACHLDEVYGSSWALQLLAHRVSAGGSC